MDNILEILVPLIFAAIYFFGNMFGKSKEEGDASPVRPERRPAGDEEAAERQRNIQEEIRRKIMERRRASGNADRPELAPASRPRSQPQKQMREVVHTNRDSEHGRAGQPPPLMSPPPKATQQSEDSAFSWDKSDDAYDQQMQTQLKRIEETKRQAAKLKKQVSDQTGKAEPTKNQSKSGGYFKGSVRKSLQDPRAARAAFIYGEVLGRPISLKKGTSEVPGLN